MDDSSEGDLISANPLPAVCSDLQNVGSMQPSINIQIMSQKILVTNFKFSVPREEFKAMVNQLAQTFAEVPGCLWKIWLIAEDKNEAGAVYLFADDAALQTFKASPLVASVLAHPALSDFELRERGIVAEASSITRAPL